MLDKQHFEENLLDGDSLDDCGGAMLSAVAVFEYLEERLESQKQSSFNEGKQNEREHIIKWLETSNLVKQINGGLRCSIDAHGPITKEMIGVASKRINGQIKEERKRLAEKYKLSQEKNLC